MIPESGIPPNIVTVVSINFLRLVFIYVLVILFPVFYNFHGKMASDICLLHYWRISLFPVKTEVPVAKTIGNIP